MRSKEANLILTLLIIIVSLSFSLAATLTTTNKQGSLQNDFSPGEFVYIKGSGFSPNSLITIDITSPDLQTTRAYAFSNNLGKFTHIYEVSQIGTYYVYATDGVVSGQVIFTDAAIWTTQDSCGTSGQDLNHFSIGDTVYINGDGFAAESYDWEIKGKPGGASCDPNIVVASGTKVVNASGAFCIAAYTIPNGDCGEYAVKFDVKGDNYRVEGNQCEENGDCGTPSSILSCQLNSIINITDTPVCVGGNCTITQTNSTVQNCGSPSSQILCVGNNVTNITTTPSCLAGESTAECVNNITIQIIEECQNSCSEGQCQETEPICGDGIVNQQSEQCDDGNNNNGDGCSSQCTIEEEQCENDEDGDGVCDGDDSCPDSQEGEIVDENGCDIFQFCSLMGCGYDCLYADWQNNEPSVTRPFDCTVVIPLRNGKHQQPICVPTQSGDFCAN